MKEARAKGRHWLVRNVEVLSRAVTCFALFGYCYELKRIDSKKKMERDNEWCILNNLRSSFCPRPWNTSSIDDV